MLRSRVTRGIDVARLSNAVARPGIDPRIWVSYGTLLSDPYIEDKDGRQDVIVDVMLLPSMQEETARVGAIYAGNGFGFYCPLHKEDEVLVLAPSGDPDEGLVIAQRLWSPADPPPTELKDHPEDVTLIVEPEKNLRITVKGEGNVVLSAEAGKIKLGSEFAEKGVARKDDITGNGTLRLSADTLAGPVPITTLTLTYTPPGGGLPQVTSVALSPCVAEDAPALSINLTGVIDSSSDTVKSI